ncbi:BRISC complex subunit Abraxas 2-like [Asterias rubens]|uniref:BRISC complex subunit Abraxas 2-like n=1 Tax=Asterias rubens TaxID=7604 RepID=UPI001455127D|nr:BRISC complex subunit Abraxas 2-like [Asterias rubens]
MAASSTVVVNVSGCVWSSLFLDHASSIGDQEGFLFGEIVRKTNTDISDSQITRKIENISINVYSHFACSEPHSFYDRKGHADKVKLLSMLKDNYKHMVGWYRFRRNTPLEPSMRESTLHKTLLKTINTDTPHLFLLGLFTSGLSWNQSTHSFNYQLLTKGDRGFQCVAVKIINLGETSHSEYKETTRTSNAAKGRGIYTSILNNFRGRLVDVEGSLQGVHVIQDVNETVYSKMQKLKNEIGQSEQMLQTEMEEVRDLQRQKREREKREVHNKMEQHARLAAANTVLPDAEDFADIPALPKAIIHHPKPPDDSAASVLVPLAASVNVSTTSKAQTKTTHCQASCLPVAESHPPAQRLPVADRVKTTTPSTSGQTQAEAPKVKVVSPGETVSKDPFAGLLKDMKRSIQKTTSLGEELRPVEGPRSTRAHSWDKTRTEVDPRGTPTKNRGWNSMELSGSSPSRGSTPSEDDSSSPQVLPSSSPTF